MPITFGGLIDEEASITAEAGSGEDDLVVVLGWVQLVGRCASFFNGRLVG